MVKRYGTAMGDVFARRDRPHGGWGPAVDGSPVSGHAFEHWLSKIRTDWRAREAT